MRASAVIGAGYGDEGKGRVTDFLAAQRPHRGFVVRSNGGAQAGHTVQTPEGARHVFHHFGSGTFAGWPTYLSRFFVSNPLLFARERGELQHLGVRPELHVDPAGLVTTPYDMLLNQAIEEQRAEQRHGSCGVGFGETIERAERGQALTVADLAHAGLLRDKLHAIRETYVPMRIRELGLELTDSRAALFAEEALVDNYLPFCAEFAGFARPCSWPDLPPRDLIFEAAQGLELDQALGVFPHVTRSHTGLRNIAALCAERNVTELDAVYATRTYKTRHGAGPLPHALADKPWGGIVDATNVPHDYQGTMRFGWLDTDRLASLIAQDAQMSKVDGLDITRNIAVTCLDQVKWPLIHVEEGKQRASRNSAEFLAAVRAALRPATVFCSYGPHRNAMEFA